MDRITKSFGKRLKREFLASLWITEYPKLREIVPYETVCDAFDSWMTKGRNEPVSSNSNDQYRRKVCVTVESDRSSTTNDINPPSVSSAQCDSDAIDDQRPLSPIDEIVSDNVDRHSMKVSDLVIECKKRGLTHTGTKQALIDKLTRQDAIDVSSRSNGLDFLRTTTDETKYNANGIVSFARDCGGGGNKLEFSKSLMNLGKKATKRKLPKHVPSIISRSRLDYTLIKDPANGLAYNVQTGLVFDEETSIGVVIGYRNSITGECVNLTSSQIDYCKENGLRYRLPEIF